MEGYGVKIKEAPIETTGSIGTVERYQAPLWVTFEKIWEESGGKIGEADCLKMEVFAVNSTVGPEGLYPMLFLNGLITRPVRRIPTEIQLIRAQAVESGMQE